MDFVATEIVGVRGAIVLYAIQTGYRGQRLDNYIKLVASG